MRHTFFVMAFSDSRGFYQENGIFGAFPWLQGLWDDIAGFTSQRKSFEEQEKLLEKEQDFSVDYNRKMQAMIEAGINPNLAASGLSGVGQSSPSAPSVASAAPASGALDALTNIGRAVTSGTKELSEAKFNAGTLQPTIDKLTNEAAHELAKLGLTNEQITAAITSNRYLEKNLLADLRIKSLNADNLSQQWKLMEAQYQLTTQQIDTELAKYGLILAQQGETAANQHRLEWEQKKLQNDVEMMRNRIDFWKQHGFDIETNEIHAILAQKIENGYSITDLTNYLCSYYGQQAGIIADAQNKSEQQYAYMTSALQSLGASYASWFGRPSNPVEVVSGSRLEALGIDGQKAALLGLKANMSYKEAHESLSNLVNYTREAWKKSMKGKDTKQQIEAWKHYQDALFMYDNFGYEEYDKFVKGKK